MISRTTSLILILFYKIYISYGNPFGHTLYPDYIYVESTKSYYKQYIGQSWTDAVATCSSEGAQMYYPEDEHELRAVAGLISYVHAGDGIWIGISDLRMNASYETVDGRPIKNVYHKWKEGEPTSGVDGDLHCVTLRTDSTLWVSWCPTIRGFICKISPEISTNSNTGIKNTISYLEKTTTEAVERKIKPSNEYSELLDEKPFGSNGPQDYIYVESTKSFYKYHDEEMSWVDAVATCSSEGAQLFYPEDETDVRAVAKVKKFSDSYDKIWVGISDLLKYTNYETIDGRSIRDIYHKWSDGEPWSGPYDGYHCVTQIKSNQIVYLQEYVYIKMFLKLSFLTFLALKGDETLWVSLCSNERDFVCKRSTDSNQNSTDTPSSFPMTTTEDVESAKPNKTLMFKDYTYLESTNSYYKYHGGPKCTWHDAVAACSSEGAQLFYPEDETEATEVGEVLNIWHNISLIWIGVSDLQEIKNYKTNDGQPITNVFHKWNSGEPSSGENDSCRCVVLWYHNALTVRECNALMNFVCKYTPETNQHHKNDTDTTPANSNTTTQAIEGKLCSVEESWQPCGELDAGSKSHLPFLDVVREELGNFPPREKLAVMESILRVIREHSVTTRGSGIEKSVLEK